MQRTFLLKLVLGLFIALFLAFVLVLFRSLDTGNEPATAAVEFADLAIGETGKRRIQNKPVWVTRLSAEQRSMLDKLAPDIVSEGGCRATQLCVLIAATARDGIDLSFTRERPPQVADEIPWSGGFVNPLNGHVYDLLGRAYKLNGADHQQALAHLTLQSE